MYDNLEVLVINNSNVNLPVNEKYISSYSSAIAERVKIFKNKGIHQWQDNYAERNSSENVTKELSTNNGESLLVFIDSETKKFVGALKLKDVERPGYWDTGEYEDDGAKYITGLVTDPQLKGAGSAVMHALGKWAKNNNVKKLRLDCKCDNEQDFLVNYYTKRGFKVVGKGYKAPTEKFSEYRYALCEGLPKDLLKANKKRLTKRNKLGV